MIDRLLTFLLRPFLSKARRSLVIRRGGVIASYKLSRTFKKVSRDKWVAQSREYYKEYPTSYAKRSQL